MNGGKADREEFGRYAQYSSTHLILGCIAWLSCPLSAGEPLLRDEWEWEGRGWAVFSSWLWIPFLAEALSLWDCRSCPGSPPSWSQHSQGSSSTLSSLDLKSPLETISLVPWNVFLVPETYIYVRRCSLITTWVILRVLILARYLLVHVLFSDVLVYICGRKNSKKPWK